MRAGVAGGLLLAATVTGCASQTEKYCSTLRDDNHALQRLSSGSGARGGRVLDRSLTIFEDLQGKAPQDVAGDWNDFVSAWRAVVDAFHAARVDPARFDPNHPPPGVSTGQLQAIKQAAADLTSQKVQAAASRIEDHARAVCKVNLGGSGFGAGGSL